MARVGAGSQPAFGGICRSCSLLTRVPRDSWGPLLLTEELLLSKEESDREIEKVGKDSSSSSARAPAGQAALSEAP